MAGAQLGTALRQIQRLFSDGSSTGLSDTQLLDRFATQRDEAAFAAIVTRHGPMVLAVCRGVLRDSVDAEDAFQATFLVLARKARSTWVDGQLGGWLHKVAYRIAVRASAVAARRRVIERRVSELAAVRCSDDETDDELRPALHEELARLPAQIRLPIVLCYLEGRTHMQAAAELRCGEATLRRRLAQARERLRERLARRGFAPASAAFTVELAIAARAAVPPVVARMTIRAVLRVAAGEAVATGGRCPRREPHSRGIDFDHSQLQSDNIRRRVRGNDCKLGWWSRRLGWPWRCSGARTNQTPGGTGCCAPSVGAC
jgi:RNA polymerase sigma factor (sigma-70 family)